MPQFPAKNPRRANTCYAWGVCGGLLLAIGLIYGQTLGHTLLDYDDNGFVYDCPMVKAGLTMQGVWWAFTDGCFGEWYPLAPLSHMLDCQLFGLEAWGHHLTNVLLHAAMSIALFLVFWRMTGELWPSAFVAALFAIHPQHVESVAWVAERRDMLSGLFFVLTLGAWLGYVRHGRSLPRYLLAALLFALGLMSKPMIVTLPPLLLLLDFWPLARVGAAADLPASTEPPERPGALWLVLEKLPLVALAAGDCVMTLRTHGSGGVSLPFAQRIANAVVSTATYLVQFFYPVDLVVFYPTPPGGPPLWKVAGACAFLVAATTAAVIFRRRCPYLFVGWFWYLGMLSPVLGLVTVSDHVMADRYMYLPGIGLYIALAWGTARLAAGSAEGRWMLGTCAALAIVVLVACAAWQTSYWRDDETLWRHALACTTDNGEAELELGDALVRKDRTEQAITLYQRAQQHATDASPFNNLGSVYARQQRFAEAIDQFRRAVAIEPKSFRAHANLGMALAQTNQLAEASEHIRLALNLNPLDLNSHCGLAHLLLLEGKLDAARAEFQRAVEIDPRNIPARDDLAHTLIDLGRFEESIPHLQAALALDPKRVSVHINLGRALAARGQVDEARSHYLRALELDPRSAWARQNLDQLLRGSDGPISP
ncbi:MAG TPA: tetratricopeptide repeat protein [Pirellulales bacterium]|nr:tetratricopeptide repeat protein [Pirellulales bacterium]